MSTNRVYLLGAGFSMAISDHGTVRDENKMPSMQDLSDAVRSFLKPGLQAERMPATVIENLKRLAQVAKSDKKYHQVIADVFESLPDIAAWERLPGLGTPLVKNFEQWLSYLIEAPPWLSPAEQARNRAAFLEVSRTVYSILDSRQRSTLFDQEGNCPDWLARLVNQWDRDSANVITFNYDQFVELAWMLHGTQTLKRARSWDLYPAPITPLTARVGYSPPVYCTPGGFTLHKMHGSLGWWYSGPDSPPGDTVYDQGIRGDQWYIDGVFPPDEMSVSLFADREPLIVPPAAVKSPYYSNSILKATWRAAADALKFADELVIMGFSLPATDMIVSSMLCTTLKDSCIITPVDYRDDIIERVCKTFDMQADDERLNSNYVNLRENAIPNWVNDHIETVS
ncbi:hypothetical protein BH09ACT8_BH09ACT8_65390 [soil metagenome]